VRLVVSGTEKSKQDVTLIFSGWKLHEKRENEMRHEILGDLMARHEIACNLMARHEIAWRFSPNLATNQYQPFSDHF
jgi:hypothetical protein